mgnify:CR=1 FL=1
MAMFNFYDDNRYHGDKFFVTNHSDYTFEEMLGGNDEQRS